MFNIKDVAFNNFPANHDKSCFLYIYIYIFSVPQQRKQDKILIFDTPFSVDSILLLFSTLGWNWWWYIHIFSINMEMMMKFTCLWTLLLICHILSKKLECGTAMHVGMLELKRWHFVPRSHAFGRWERRDNLIIAPFTEIQKLLGPSFIPFLITTVLYIGRIK